MSGSFVELTETETSRPMLVNLDGVICIAPHGRGGSFVFLTGGPGRIEVDETPGRISELLHAAGVMYSQREIQE